MSNENDIFKKAAQESITASLKVMQTAVDESIEVKEDEQTEIAIQHVGEGDKWDNLAKYVNGDGADRLVKALIGMGDRDFVRNYLKLLEHFKPKLTRSDQSPDEEANRTITIELVQQLPDGEKRIITLNNKKDE